MLLCSFRFPPNQLAHLRQRFITRNQLNFAQFDLRDSLADFVDVCASNLRGDIISQTCDQVFCQRNTRLWRQSQSVLIEFFSYSHSARSSLIPI